MPRPRTPEETHCEKISISFEQEDLKRLNAYCQKHERHYSWVIRKALREWLDKHEDDPAV